MRLLDGRSYAYQWDSNIYVILPKAKIGEEIHFAHRKDKLKRREAIIANVGNHLIFKDTEAVKEVIMASQKERDYK